jgi:acyl-lipid omega-6 desaturase (Delta-12 desaturase)
MNDTPEKTTSEQKKDQQDIIETPDMPAQDWVRILASYRQPNTLRSLFELAVTIGPLAILWAAAYWALGISIWLSLGFSVLAAGFLVRLFIVQHDCGHGAFFRLRAQNDWLGRFLGVVTLTPYFVWKRGHAIHHASSGNLDKRGIGDIHTKTVREYNDLTWRQRLGYRLYRHPLGLFVVGPVYLFIFQNRVPLGFFKSGRAFWISSMGTNIGIAVFVGILIYFFGLVPFLLTYLPISLLAGAFGMWMFYVQHQFEETYWDWDKDWTVHEAALYGSSHYDLPTPLRWISGNIGVHHVHHLYSRIPFYKLHKVLEDHPALTNVRRLTLWQSITSYKYQLWDEGQRKLVSYATARRARAA